MAPAAGDVAWVLVSAALVMLMTPGPAFFYGGTVRAGSVLNMLMLNVVCIAVVGLVWVVCGFSLSFGHDSFRGLIGGAGDVGLQAAITGVVGFAATDPPRGDATQLVRQAIAAGAVGLYSFAATLVLGYLIRSTIGFRVRRESELHGVDGYEHAETGYELGPAALGLALQDADSGRHRVRDGRVH